MTTCYSCRWSYFGYAKETVSGFTLMCKPDGEKDRIQDARLPCQKYQREPGADEPSEVNTTEERK